MDFGSSSCSRTRGGLVRKKGIFAPSRASCSRTRSGLVRDSSDSSSSRTRSGLLRIKSFVDSSDDSSSRSQSDLARRSPPIVEAIINDEAVLKVSPDEWMKEDMPVKNQNGLVRESSAAEVVTKDESGGLSNGCLSEDLPSKMRSGLVRRSPRTVEDIINDEAVSKESPEGWMKEDMPVRTQNGLAQESSAAKALTKEESGMKVLPDGCLSEDMPSRTRSGLVRRSPTVKTLSKDRTVIKGLPDGSLKEDTPLGTRSGLVRGRLAAKVPIKAELVAKGQPAKTVSNHERVAEGLPVGWRKENRPKKNGGSYAYYIDPVSGYEFFSLKDVHRYLETGDIRQCAMRPKKSTICDVCMTESQIHTSASSRYTRPGTADKAIQCEILTSDGILVPWEELITPYSGNDAEHTVSSEPESLKDIQGYGNKLETLEHTSVQPVSAQYGSRQTKSVKRKEPNVEVKSKKRKTNSTVTPVRMSSRLAALNVQLEVSTENEDEMVSINHVNQVQTLEENAVDQKRRSGTVDQINSIPGSTFNLLQSNQADTANGMQAMQETTTIHSQPSQLDILDPIQKSQENTANQLQSILTDSLISKQNTQECTIDQPSQLDKNHINTNQEYTGNQFQSSLLTDTVIPLGSVEENTVAHSQPSNSDTTNQIQANEENTADQVQLSLAETVIPVPAIQEYATGYSQPSKANTMNQTQVNQEHIADQVQSSLVDTVIPVQGIPEYTTDYSHLSNADITNQIQANQENTDDHLYLSQVHCVTQMQIIEENLAKQPQLNQSDTQERIHIDLESTTNHLQPNYDDNSMLQSGFSWAPEQNGGAPLTDFWKNVESQVSSVPMPIDVGAPVASFPANVRFHNAAAAAESALPTQVAPSETLFGNIWSDPCIEFAFKTLTGDIPVLDDTTAVTDYFPEQQDLNKSPAPNCVGSVFDNSRNHTQVDVNLPAPAPSDNLYNGSWFPPQ